MKKIFIAAPIAFAIIGYAAFRAYQNRAQEDYIAVKRGTAIEAVYGIGTVTAVRTYQAKAGVATGIVGLPVQEGQTVQKGDILVSLTEGSSFRAPFSGTITKIFYKIGESVFAGNPIVSLIDLKELYISVTLDQKGAIHVAREQLAKMNFEGLPGKVFEGKVQSIYPSENQFVVRIDLKGIPSQILPGMTADVAIQTGQKEKALLIPAAAIASKKVIRLRGRERKEIDVNLGIVDEEFVEVTGGDLVEGDQVALRRK